MKLILTRLHMGGHRPDIIVNSLHVRRGEWLMEGAMHKVCCECKKSKELIARNFGVDKSQPDGRARKCKYCKKKVAKALREGNRKKPKSKAGEVRRMSFECRSSTCHSPTRASYINMDDYERMKDAFFCDNCLKKAGTEEQLYDCASTKARGDLRPSELPLISS